jgi:hypothetical protein
MKLYIINETREIKLNRKNGEPEYDWLVFEPMYSLYNFGNWE